MTYNPDNPSLTPEICTQCGNAQTTTGICSDCAYMNHDPDPIESGIFVSMCRVCTEKVIRHPDGSWVHFGVGQPYEEMTL